PGAGCSSMRVRRLLAGELSGVEKERTEAHLAGCARCAVVQQEIAAEREALRRDVPFPQFAAAGLALVAGTALVLRPADTEVTRSKGGGAAQLFVQDQGGVREVAPGEMLAPGARLLLSLQPGGHKRAAAILLEPGEASVVYDGPARSGT